MIMNEWGRLIDEWCDRKGWNQNLVMGNMIANLHSEISEAWEEIRNGHSIKEVYFTTSQLDINGDNTPKPEGFGIEMADLIIRILHICAHYGLDIDSLVEQKMAYNEKRPYRHGGKLA